MSAVDEFRKSLPNNYDGDNFNIVQWSGTPRRSNNLLEINSKKKSSILYIKASNISPGFWGLTKNQIDRLNNSQIPWFVVLLLKRKDSGYVLSSKLVNAKIQDGTFELSKDGDHKVNEISDLNSDMAFRGIKNLLERIL